MKLIDRKLLREFSEKGCCEFCHKKGPVDAHHIFGRGAGRVDIRENLVSLDRACHTSSHAGCAPDRVQLLAISSKREGKTPDEIMLAVYAVRNDQSQKVKEIT